MIRAAVCLECPLGRWFKTTPRNQAKRLGETLRNVCLLCGRNDLSGHFSGQRADRGAGGAAEAIAPLDRDGKLLAERGAVALNGGHLHVAAGFQLAHD